MTQPSPAFAVGHRVVCARAPKDFIEPEWLIGNAGKIVGIYSPDDHVDTLTICVELTHPNGHPHHHVGDRILFAADELEYVD
ncbi:hypothetical protein PBI_BLUEBERRY_81 [Gordonia phage Blueberry]|uniref:Uncharacterized protein n=2 Tax=Jujuvirus TaxID=2948772 RepID=A0A7G8LKX1_9CAUD|nr:hypothetical protein BH771_gp81 [Gordonia phage Blueberry]YP_010096958.1 hypothetical protein KNT98_gp81 [Gordonia phage Frokostdame]YP_010110008.1 hypothetical protein KNV23_gp82 [Gordonia phage Azula]QGJ97456.1 hypothetical protein SEA_GAMBINO_84 [Gordonia phage Gambino]QZD97514.1 hypothetical protein SEA_MISSRONA_82 [Gordonia phage MissRona]ANA85543.1 hypothetical protein PBI_BLUEBERRY_81 [Gordonia phage Blueberry]AXH49723.1 hypothetical protein SEA_FROKOSTDAME_81 [Gordonia phage Frokos